MPHALLTRRSVMAGGAALALTAFWPLRGRTQDLSMHVVKDPACGCCSAWIEILQADGFEITTEAAFGDALNRVKREAGLPAHLVSCHTGRIDGYTIEGHVPTADIRRLLAERPDAVGLAVPGMPYGSPGMGPESARDAFDVHLVRRDGSSEIFSRYAAA